MRCAHANTFLKSGLALPVYFLLLLPAFARQPSPAPATLPELQQRISAIIDEPRYRSATWGIKIVSLDSKKTLFECNADKLFSPASNSKLYTMALALDRLGPDYRIRTSLYARARPDRRGTLKGDLIVYGRGDPSINTSLHTNLLQALEPLVAALTNAGVRRVTGDLVGDDSCFRGPPFGSGWLWGDLENDSGAEVSALTINDNTLQAIVKPAGREGAPCLISFAPPTGYLIVSNRTVTAPMGATRYLEFYRGVGENVLYVTGQLPLGDAEEKRDVTVHNPAGLFVSLLKEAMARRGISVSGRTRAANWLDRAGRTPDAAQWIELGAIESPPMREILPEVLKPSQNLYTDLVLCHVGTVITNTPGNPRSLDDTTEEAGVHALRQFLDEAGLPRDQTFLEEGSGLSRNNLTSPNATVALLAYMSRHSCAELYRNSLPVAGVDGTLRRRMRGTAAEGNVRAKTGTLAWANSLSGYVTTAAGEHLAFSIMLNRYHNSDPGRQKTADIDAIAVMLAGYSGR